MDLVGLLILAVAIKAAYHGIRRARRSPLTNEDIAWASAYVTLAAIAGMTAATMFFRQHGKRPSAARPIDRTQQMVATVLT